MNRSDLPIYRHINKDPNAPRQKVWSPTKQFILHDNSNNPLSSMILHIMEVDDVEIGFMERHKAIKPYVPPHYKLSFFRKWFVYYGMVDPVLIGEATTRNRAAFILFHHRNGVQS